MKEHHPDIIMDFVPAGCTGVAQPCDVGIQHPIKLSMKRSYHEDILEDMCQQLDASKIELSIDEKLGTLQDSSIWWMWNAYQAVNKVELITKVIPNHTFKNVI